MENAPERIQVIENILEQNGVETLEVRIGSLLLGKGCQCHFIEMKPGMFCAEHPHASISLTYTVKGQRVLSSQGKRFHMKAGTLFWLLKRIWESWPDFRFCVPSIV